MWHRDTIIDRLMPALLMATSLTLLTAGLLSYAPSGVGDWRTPEPELVAGDPLLTFRPAATPAQPSGSSGAPSPSPTNSGSSPAPSESPSAVPMSPSPTPAASAQASPLAALASRIRIPSLGIDLPVVPGDLLVPGNRDFYPLCDVAMYMPGFVAPGQQGATYIYAHAQRGMFAPLLKASEVNDGASMIGALIEVYTSDNLVHLYELSQVKRHALDLSLADVPVGQHILVLQTSEGPSGTVPKLQVAGRPLSVVPADPAEANPEPHPRVCLPAANL